MSDARGYERPAVAGSGTIACGLAASASIVGPVTVLARSEESAQRAAAAVEKLCSKLDGADAGKVRVTAEMADVAGCDLVVEAIAEEADAKGELLRGLAATASEADLATTTSSFPIAELAERSGQAERLFGLHVFNPVPRMELVELCLPEGLRAGVAERARAWCEALGKRPVKVPDQPGFVVNRLLFPYLFDAVRMMERTGMDAAEIDECMTLGAGHPMGPLKLLDFVGLDVAVAIGRQLHADSEDPAHGPPALLETLAAEGKLGRKAGSGFYEYD